jgi:hypothetical protein
MRILLAIGPPPFAPSDTGPRPRQQTSSGAGAVGGGGVAGRCRHEAPINASNSACTRSSSCVIRSVNASSNHRSHSGDKPIISITTHRIQ